jgi:outer membrane immunogenic protein
MATLVAACSAVPAFADAPSGTRIEAQVGYDHAAVDFGGFSVGKSGLNYGGVVGYDLPVYKNLALGADVGIDGSTAKTNLFGATVHVGRDYYVGGRATVNVAPKTNLYAIVGYANGRLTGTYQGVDYAENRGGIRFGPGVQYTVGHEAYVSLQYDHTSYQDHASRDRVLVGAGLRL